MIIKRIREDDIECIKECDTLFLKFLDSEGRFDYNYLKRDSLNSFSTDVKDDNKILLASIENDKVVGFLFGYIEKRKDYKEYVANISFLYVDNEYRNKKIATSLINTYLKELEERQISILEVKTYEENTIAQKLYSKYGFDKLWSNYRKKI